MLIEKHIGEVCLSLNLNQLKPSEISIMQGTVKLQDESEISSLLSSLQSRWQPHHNNKRVSVTEVKPLPKVVEGSDNSEINQKLTTLFEEELFLALRKTNIFNTKALRNNIKRAVQHRSFRKLAGKGADKLASLESNLIGSERLGLFHEDYNLKKELCGDTPIRVAIPAPVVGAQILFNYLKEVKGYNIEVLYRYPHAVELVRKISSGEFSEPPDLCVVGTPPLARLLNSSVGNDYKPLMLMPYLSQRIVSKKTKQKSLDHGRYMFINDDPSHPSFFFDDLEHSGKVRTSSVEVEHGEPDDAFAALKDGDPDLKAILFFPYYTVNTKFNGCQELTNPLFDHNLHELVLVGHKKFTHNNTRAQLLEIALRDAWLSLLEQPDLARRLNKKVLQEKERMTFIKRVSGLSHLEAFA